MSTHGDQPSRGTGDVGATRTDERHTDAPPRDDEWREQAEERREDRLDALREEMATRRRDRLRWGPVWGGLVIAVGLYLVFQLLLVAFGIADLTDPGTDDAIWSGGAALVAFLLGGVVVGATIPSTDVTDGILHGIVMWALAIVTLLALSAFSSGLALGAIDTTDVFDDVTIDEIDASEAEDAAGRALIGLLLALAAAAVGAAAGAKLWPRDTVIDLAERRSAGTPAARTATPPPAPRR
ncbi:MAG TPA: hypothetical protein VK866_00170 [Acidimicrobiales bacterium]|nr:hypothetical protein [Acidimicrobiales bacterium]